MDFNYDVNTPASRGELARRIREGATWLRTVGMSDQAAQAGEAADKIERGEPVGDTLGCIADDLFGYDAADAFRDFDVWTRTIG